MDKSANGVICLAVHDGVKAGPGEGNREVGRNVGPCNVYDELSQAWVNAVKQGMHALAEIEVASEGEGFQHVLNSHEADV